VADGFRIAEGYLDIEADPSAALRNVQEFLRRVERDMRRAEDEAEASGRRTGRRFGDGLDEGLRGPHGGNLINDLVLGGGGGEGEGGGGGGGFIQSIIGGFSNGFRRVIDEIRTLIGEIESMLSNLGGGGGFLSDLREGLSELISGIRDRFESLINYLHGTWTRFFGSLTNGPIGDFFSDLLTRARAYWTRFTAWASSSFTVMWTRVRTWWANMSSNMNGYWVRFNAWASATFRRLRILGEYFWIRFRAGARSLFTNLRGWTRGWINDLGIMGRWVWGRIRNWAGNIWSRMSSRGRSIWTRIAGWARSAITSIGGWFSSFFTWLSNTASTVGSQLNDAFSNIGKAAGAAGPVLQVAAYAALIPIIIGLGGAIAQLLPLLLLLPAAIATLISILAPAIVAFKGFGAAVGAGLSGDVEKFNEALKKLTPNARAVAKEFVALGPALKRIKSWTQNALFLPLIGTIKPLATTLLPALEQGMAKAASGLGRLLAGFAKMLATPEVISAINTLFATTERILDRLGPPLANLFGALFGTVEGGLPWIERLVDTIANGIDRFANWLREIKQTGQMQSWLMSAWDAAKKFWDLLVALGALVGSLFANSGDEGLSWIEDLTNMVKKLTDYFKSAEGIEFLETIVSWMDESGGLMLTLVDIISTLLNAFVGLINFLQAIPGAFAAAWQWIKKTTVAVGEWIAMAAGVTWDWIKGAASAVADFFKMIGSWFVDAYNTVVGWGSALLDWFSKIPGWIGEFFSNLPGWIADGLAATRDAIFYGIGWVAGFIVGIFLSIPGALAAAWEWISTTVMNGVTKTADFVRTLPQRAGEALASLGSTIGGAVDAAWDWAYESTSKGVQYSWSKTQELVGRVGEILSALPGRIGGWVTEGWNRGREATSSGIDRVVSTARELPGKIGSALSGAGSWLYNVGRDMISGLIRGLGDALGWAVDQAKRAANKIKEGFLDALDSHSPSRVMDREVGRTILPGVVQGIKRDIPDTMRYLGTVANMMVQGFQPTVNVAAPNVHTGDVMLTADFGEGIRQVVPLIITRNPRAIAGANAVGTRERSGWVNTARGTVG
jgi:phage-related protein